MKAIVTVIGKDRVGITAAVCSLLAQHNINILDISQTVLQEFFTMVMLDVGYLLSGSVLIETVFSYPGLGTLMQEAVQTRDYPLIQYTFLVSSVLTIAALFLADTLHHRVDPRVEVERDE